MKRNSTIRYITKSVILILFHFLLSCRTLTTVSSVHCFEKNTLLEISGVKLVSNFSFEHCIRGGIAGVISRVGIKTKPHLLFTFESVLPN